MSEEQTTEINWRDSLPDTMQGATALQDVKSVESLAQQFIDQGKHLGNAIRIPGEDATTEDQQAFRQRLLDKNIGLMHTPDLTDDDAMGAIYDTLGRPKEATEYHRPEKGIDDARFTMIADLAHKAGISNKQFESVIGNIVAADNESLDASIAERETGLTELRSEWSTAYDSKIARAGKMAELTKAPQGLIDAIKAGSVDAGTLKWLDSMSESLGGENSEMISQVNDAQTGITKEEARERAGEIMRTIGDMPQSDPRYQGLLEKRLKFIEIYTD